MTETDRQEAEISETVVFPQVSGLNWPSYLLQAWRTLHGLGVPEENLRLLPQIGHFAVPEIGDQEPPGPVFDPFSERMTVHYVHPAAVRPRLTVSIRADVIEHFLPPEEEGSPERHESRLVGRLAHFVPPLLAGLPGAPPPARTHSPLEDLTQQVCARYPELMQTLTPEERGVLEAGADDLLAILAETNESRRAALIEQAVRRVGEPDLRAACRAAWPRLIGKLPPRGIAGLEDRMRSATGETLKRWALLLYGADQETAAQDTVWTDLTPAERDAQRALLRALLPTLSYETKRERERIVRELMEIVSTEALLATAVIDSICGIGWVHGRISDQRAAGMGKLDGWFLSVTGGRSSRSLLQSRLEEWADAGGVLGVTAGVHHDAQDDRLTINALDEIERMQLWSLAAWRRDSADPFVLLETAAKRLIHPDVIVRPRSYVPAISRPGTLLAQLGSTAVLGGPSLLLYPGITLEMPLSDDDPNAAKARTTLAVLLRLFLPVCCRVEILWRESAARLDRPSYLHHEFQSGARLGHEYADMPEDEAAGDPATI